MENTAYISFRKTDNRTATSYSVKDKKIVASDSNYCIEQFKKHHNPFIENNRIFSNGIDVTEETILEINRYAIFDFTKIPELSFIGKNN